MLAALTPFFLGGLAVAAIAWGIYLAASVVCEIIRCLPSWRRELQDIINFARGI